MTVAPPPPPFQSQPASASTQAIVSLVLGILGIFCCGFLAPVAWYLGSQELKAIQTGASPAAGESLAKAGRITGIVGSVLLVLGILWIFFLGGMAVLQGVAASH